MPLHTWNDHQDHLNQSLSSRVDYVHAIYAVVCMHTTVRVVTKLLLALT